MTQNIASTDYGSNIAGTIHPDPFTAALAAWKRQRDRLNSLPSGTSNEVETHELDLLTEAENRLLATPVSNVSHLRALAEVIWQDADSIPTSHMLASFFAAIRKLDAGKRSLIFSVEDELAAFKERGGGWIERGGEVVFLHSTPDILELFNWLLDTRGELERAKSIVRESVNRRDTQATWGQLVSDYQTAQAKVQEQQTHYCEEWAASSPEYREYQEKFDVLVLAAFEATMALIKRPAPDAAAFVRKTEVVNEQEAFQYTQNQEVAEALAKDAQRLFG